MKPTVALVNWFGPYSLGDAAHTTFDDEDGLCMEMDKRHHETDVAFQRMGLAPTLARRRYKVILLAFICSDLPDLPDA